MTVQELITRLQELPPDAVALVRDVEGELREVDDADVVPSWTTSWGDISTVYITGNY